MLSLISIQLLNSPASWSVRYSVIGGAAYLATLSTSIICYRLSPFHPLAGFPGPFWFKVSMWIPTARMWATGRAARILQELHNRYGDFVRIGPNEISIRDPDAMHAIAADTQFRKDEFYDSVDAVQDMHSLITIRDPAEHATRRRAWAKVFTSTAFLQYLPGMYRRATNLVLHIEELLATDPNKLVDLSSLMSCSAMDYMGDLAYSGGFELINDPSMRETMELVEGYTKFVGATVNLSYLLSFLRKTMPVAPVIRSYLQLVQHCIDTTIAAGQQQVPNLIQTLLESKETRDMFTREPLLLLSEGFLITGAGSETVAFALSALWRFLLQYPADMQALVSELDQAAKSFGGECPSHDVLSTLPLLNATISETLRLWPSVPSATPRRLRPDQSVRQRVRGVMLAGKFIPEGTLVRTPYYPIHRDPRHWGPDAHEFRPARWLGLSNTPHAFAPFSLGARNCVGKDFAWREIRLVISSLLLKFNIAAPEGFNPEDWEKAVFDSTSAMPGPLPVKMTIR